jgi:hypothetical protein
MWNTVGVLGSAVADCKVKKRCLSELVVKSENRSVFSVYQIEVICGMWVRKRNGTRTTLYITRQWKDAAATWLNPVSNATEGGILCISKRFSLLSFCAIFLWALTVPDLTIYLPDSVVTICRICPLQIYTYQYNLWHGNCRGGTTQWVNISSGKQTAGLLMDRIVYNRLLS